MNMHKTSSLRSRLIVMAVGAALMTPAVASAQHATSVVGFGGVGLSTLDSVRPSLGGSVTFDLTRNVQVSGEVGRVANVLPPLSSSVFSAANTGLRVSAFYGEAGVRILAAPASPVTPYGEASVGIARLGVSSDRFGTIGNLATSLALGVVGRTSPIAGAGGGLLVRGGPVVFDLGYRYKQVFADDVLRMALGFGQPLRAHEVRAGIGFRF